MTVVGVWRRDGGRRGFDGIERFEGFDMLWHVGLMEVRGVGEVRRKGEMVGEGFGEREGMGLLITCTWEMSNKSSRAFERPCGFRNGRTIGGRLRKGHHLLQILILL
ncbi:hypothetical protein HID58_011581 [Brassica napus]|uniref:Uncharacterized protein n=1 Tax=Brassica napus TaxID=3708 RepID=A0ABQ8DYR4_BRANA|nr:hypothetical protein HID58_011581 [Brassica napus]